MSQTSNVNVLIFHTQLWVLLIYSVGRSFTNPLELWGLDVHSWGGHLYLEDSQAFSSQGDNQPNSRGECYCALTPNQTNTVHINFSKASQSSRSWSSVAVHTSRKRVHPQRSPSFVWFQQWTRPVIISTNFFRFLLSIQRDPCKLWKGILKNHFTLPTPLPIPVCSIIIQNTVVLLHLSFLCPTDSRRSGAAYCLAAVDADGRSEAELSCHRHGRHQQAQLHRRCAASFWPIRQRNRYRYPWCHGPSGGSTYPHKKHEVGWRRWLGTGHYFLYEFNLN